MQVRMQVPGGGVWRTGACDRGFVARVQQQQLAGTDAREMPSVRIHQEAAAVFRDGKAEMVGDRLVPVEPGRPAKCRGQVGTGLGFGRRYDSHDVTPACNQQTLGLAPGQSNAHRARCLLNYTRALNPHEPQHEPATQP